MMIRTKLLIIIVLIVAFSVLAILMNITWEKKYGALVEKEKSVKELNFAIFETAQIRDEYFRFRNERTKNQWLLLNNRFNGITNIISETFDEPDEKAAAANIIQANKKINNIFKQLIILDEEQAPKTAVTNELSERLLSQLMVSEHGVYSEGLNLQKIIGYKVKRQHELANLYINITFVVFAFIVVVFSIIIIRNITGPLLRLRKGTEVISEGNLDYRTDIKTRDEIGDLSDSFDMMAEKLKVTTVSRDKLNKEVEERKWAEKALQESESKYRSIFDNVVEGIFQTTPDGRFLTVNPSLASIYGYNSPEELIETITDIGRQVYVNPDERNEFLRIIQEKGLITGFELQLRKKDGSTFWGSINARTVYDENGKFLYYEGTTEEITLRKLADEELKATAEKLRKSLAGTIHAMSLTVETRDPYTSGHQKRVSNLSRTIAQEMELPNDTVENIRMAGIIHDIGKISIPAEILSKPGKLANLEMSLIRVNSQSGYDILKDVELPYPIAEIVLQHHERLDGSGYPQGLNGGNTLIEARIIAVVDVVEAMASHRPYRPAKGIEAALEEIEKNKGILYDEMVVEVCLKLFREKGFVFEPTES